jgi:predicted transcriptional regulator
MATTELTLLMDDDELAALDGVCRRTGRTRTDVAAEAIRRQVALWTFADVRRQVMPYAAAAGYLTDEDVFRDVS